MKFKFKEKFNYIIIEKKKFIYFIQYFCKLFLILVLSFENFEFYFIIIILFYILNNIFNKNKN